MASLRDIWVSMMIWSAQPSRGRPLGRHHVEGGVEARMSMAWLPGCRWARKAKWLMEPRLEGRWDRMEIGERRKTYSAAVIDGFKRTSTIYVGDSIVRKTDTRLSKGKDVVVCLPGARIEHVTEIIEKIMGRGNGGSFWYTSGRTTHTRKGQQRYLRSTETYRRRRSKPGVDRSSYKELYQCLKTGYKDTEIRSGWQSTRCWRGFARERKWDTCICGTPLWGKKTCTWEMACIWVERERAGEALQGRGSGIRGCMGQLYWERRNVRERWPASE